MQITRVELKNIKSHAESEFTFRPGVVAICGPNGSGKTTIIEAIAWALFNHLDYKRDDFVRRGAKRGQVAISFISDLDGREYVVTRDTGGGYYVYDPATKMRLVEQKNQVVPWLQQHIGVDPGTDLSALFKTTIGVPQGTFTYDFTLAPSNRKAIFDQILKVEEYRQASDNLRDTLRHIEARLVEADKRLAEAEGELKTYDETRREHDAVEQRLKMLASELETANAERNRLTREIEQFNELQRKIEGQRGAIERLRVKLDFTRGSLITAREAAEQARTAAKTVEAAAKGYELYLATISRLTQLERQRETRDLLRNRVTAIERELIEARSQAMRSQERLVEAENAREELLQLSGKVEEQNAIERKIAGLREGRGELQSLRRSLEALDREIEKLRQRYSALSHQLATAEAQREQGAAAESLEKERAQLDEEIARRDLAYGNYQLKREHLETLRKEETRLTAELERNRNEIERLGPLVSAAAQIPEFESQQQVAAEKLAQLRAEVARDEEMISALESGGICPLLSEKCLNLKPGESLDSRFRSGLVSRRDEIESLQVASIKLAEDLKRARAVAAEMSRLPHLQRESARLTQELEMQCRQIAKIAEETSLGATISESGIRQLRSRRSELEKQLRRAREAERVFSQAEVLCSEMGEVAGAGEVKKTEREDLTLRVAKLGDIEAQLAESEQSLHALGDPRGRTSALNRIIAREEEWKREAEMSARRVTEVNADLETNSSELKSFASLDSDIAILNQSRVESEGDYQAYIANEKIAATVTAREQEAAALTSETEETDKSLSAAVQELSEFEKRYTAEQHARAHAEFERWRERATQIAAQLEHTRDHYLRLQAQLNYLNEVREKMREQLAVKEKTSRLREAADFIRDVLQKAAPYITESYLFTISHEANLLFREITGRYDVTLRWAKDYEITFEEEGRERPFLNLSGGEQMAAALSVRLALLKELSEINLAFFDEPTTNMDEERRRNLAQQIGRIKDFHQLFVISHDDSFEEFTDQIISLGEKS
ncbi:MAG: SMC family ATPase [Acidobacteria bacterium]|nr:SMC family ATPase [Acidobacteriota bacterium]